jgi:cytochrome c biogenesis protein CcmG/thiol:disulfide interchange protein DsbE
MRKRVFKGSAVAITAAVILISALTLVGFGCKKTEGEKGANGAGPPGGAAGAAAAAVKKSNRAGHVAIPFKVETFSGGLFNLEDTLGRPVVLNFWASWCGPCRFEAATLQDAHERFKGSGVAFIGVAVQDLPEESALFMRQYGWTFPSGPDSTGEITKAYSVYGIPKTFIIDRSGKISYVHTGAITDKVLTREIERVL